jgi:CRISPR/Cas system CMR-associated protein Cmr5 small subunit
MSQTREQQRALTAHAQVLKVPAGHWDKYRTATLKAQALIRNAGLCQALHFLQNKDKEGGAKFLVTHLHEHLKEGRAISDGDFLERIRLADLPEYLVATREALQCLVWQCRMVESLKDQKEKEQKKNGGA